MKRSAFVYAIPSTPTIDPMDLLRKAVHLYEAGQPTEAVALALQVLQMDPNQVLALFIQGLAAIRTGDFLTASRALGRANELQPNNPELLMNLGNAQFGNGDLRGARHSLEFAGDIAPHSCDIQYNLGNVQAALEDFNAANESYLKAISLSPEFVAAWFNFANTLLKLGEFPEAETAYRKVLELDPVYPNARMNFGLSLLEQSRYAEAIRELEVAVEQDHSNPFGPNNLGTALSRSGQLAPAIEQFKLALKMEPRNADALANIARALLEMDDAKEALGYARQAIEIDPRHPNGLAILGSTLLKLDQLDDAVTYLKKAYVYSANDTNLVKNLAVAHNKLGLVGGSIEYLNKLIELVPTNAEAFGSLGVSHHLAGNLDEAHAAMWKAVEMEPEKPDLVSNYLMVLSYMPQISPEKIKAETVRLGRQAFPATPAAIQPRNNAKIRVGFVSCDLRNHPVGRMVSRLVDQFDTSRYEVFAYGDVAQGDSVTAAIAKGATRWESIFGMSDTAVVDLIQRDGIDVLFDLSGFTAGNRLGVFARRAAPVQASWLGYFATTGLEAMDYIFGDPFLIPSDEEEFYTEKVCRLPSLYLFDTPEVDVEIESRPVGQAIRFGCFNNIGKVHDDTIDAWADILKQVPSATLTFNRPVCKCDTVRNRLSAEFLKRGIAADRIVYKATFGYREYLESHRDIDIMLDTFPFSGGTTTMESLWMGVPTLTCSTRALVGRMGESILQAAGRPTWVTTSHEEYVSRAVQLANADDELAQFRAEARTQLLASTLCDKAKFTHGFFTAVSQIALRDGV